MGIEVAGPPPWQFNGSHTPTGHFFWRTPAPRLQTARLKGAVAAEVHRAACSPQKARRPTGLIRATPLSEDPQSAASSLIVLNHPIREAACWFSPLASCTDPRRSTRRLQ